ncbi:LOB domain-containing protein 36 [Phtheirospermum japonicum]|uniref:LOB domain-containing protein 36 n=1 Tax=Phtheirospermum japonicum TaxID=374723 RepID=A0A830CXM9_9LAMI|nr:LOB domain-containing protein 36 [Phtheirospermum japonicum]
MSSSYAPCAACKYLRRKCTQECVFAPYFPPDNPQKFINVHKVFGASNVGKILNELNPTQRNDAVNSLAYEAECRIKDPIYGCVGFVSLLQHHLRQVQQEIERAKKELATYIGPAAMQPILNSPAQLMQQNFDPSVYQTAPYQGQGQGQLVIQEPPQQNQQLAAAREQEMLRAYAQQQQLQQEQQYAQQMQQQQELYAQQQQGLYVQQQQQQQNEIVRFNDAGDGFVQIPADGAAAVQPALALGGLFETHYQTQEQAHSHHQQQLQIQELLLQSPQHLQLMPHQFGAQPQRDGSEEERSFGPL